jgi:hypothetical protein
LLVAIPVVQGFTIRHKSVPGFIPAADLALASAPSSIHFVSGTAAGEGAFIAEIAMRDPARDVRVLRATKTLARMDWDGGHYQCLFQSPDSIHWYLRRSHVSVIVLEEVPASELQQHHVLLTRMLNEHQNEWIPLHPGAADSSPVRVKVFHRVPDATVASQNDSDPLDKEFR